MATENSKRVLDYLKAHYQQPVTKQTMAQELGVSISAVVGSTNGLNKKGLLIITEDTIDVDGKQTAVKFVTLNEAGFNFDFDAYEAAEAEKKAAIKQAKAAEKAAAKEAAKA